MFTGIVTDIGEVVSVHPRADNLRRLKIACSYDRTGIADGASIACNGVCLTVVGAGEEDGHTLFSADAAAETLAVTTAGSWRVGSRLNLERSLRLGDELGGHMVMGHVDAVATVVAVKEDSRDWRITFQVAPEITQYIVPKGSIAVDGVSMTIAEVAPAPKNAFTLAVIPTTLERTTLSALRTGDRVNVETDILARTVVHWLSQMQGGNSPKAKDEMGEGGITLAKLRELGMT